GIWRLLDRLGLRLRSGRVQQFSPDPAYADKLIDLEMALWEARRYPRAVAAVFLDEMGFARWPDPAPDWPGAPPLADRRRSNNGLWRLVGALNPFTGQVNYLDATASAYPTHWKVRTSVRKSVFNMQRIIFPRRLSLTG